MIDQKHPENVEYFNYLGSMVTKHCMQDVYVKLNPGLPRKKLHSTRRSVFYRQTGLKFRE